MSFVPRRFFSALAAVLLFVSLRAIAAVPFVVQGPGVDTNDFRVTVFASGLDFPLGMAELSDGSLLVNISQGANYFSSAGRIVRFTDTNSDGVADDPGTTLYSGLSGTLTALRVAGNLVIVTGSAKPIVVLRQGATPADPLTFVGQMTLSYPGGWSHQHSALGLRRTPGYTNRYDLLFQIGSQSNFAVSTGTVSLTNSGIAGAIATLSGDSIYLITLMDDGVNVTATNITQLADGLRNPAGFTFQSATGDLLFQDNGIDGATGSADPVSADELNFIARTNIGDAVGFFGFPSNYISYRTNVFMGGAGVPPLIAFQPLPDPFTGHESEGPNDITFAPPGFPDGLNSGIFLGFHGRFSSGGTNNEENPVVYASPTNGTYFHFIEGRQAGIGHLDGLLVTRDSLFVADLCTNGNAGAGAGQGVIYQIKSLVTPIPPTLELRVVDSQVELTWDRGHLQEADDVTGPWTDVDDAFSPYWVTPTGLRKFYRSWY